MRLILHIGTHKTGTTAVQQFLVDNRPALAQHGFYYATAGASADANVIANTVALDETDKARDFFSRQFEAASQAGAQAVIVSAENFYSMAVVAAALSQRMPDEALSQEPVLVKRLHDLLPEGFSSTRIVAYFRRPDRFAESLYNQRIKYETYDEPFERYLQAVRPMFDYHSNATAWADVFGKDNCTFSIYESVQGDMRQAFLRDVLGLTDTNLFVYDATRDNERVSRDVLEFKRELNKTTPDAERDLQYRIACQLERDMDLLSQEPKHYGEFMSPARREEFLAELAPSIDALRSSFDLPEFPPVEQETAGWTRYPGLSDERRTELQRQYARIRRQPPFRRQRLELRSRRTLHRSRAGKALIGRLRRTRVLKG